MGKENYQQLQPLTVEQRVWIAIAALKFFQPMCYRESCQKIGKTPEENIIRPLDTLGFLKYLAVDGVLPDKMLDKPERYLQRINELLARLVFSGHLSHAGKSGKTIGHPLCFAELAVCATLHPLPASVGPGKDRRHDKASLHPRQP